LKILSRSGIVYHFSCEFIRRVQNARTYDGAADKKSLASCNAIRDITEGKTAFA